MKIATTTLLGPGTLDQARDALKLVRDIAWMHLIIADPKDATDAHKLASELGDHGDHGDVYLEPWLDFSHARNVSLRVAAERGADWALTVDTDESIFLPADIREQLESSTHPVGFVGYEGGAYAKERVFRLPAHGAWTGPTHECFVPGSFPWMIQGASFIELAKSPDALKRKCERDVALLAPYIHKHPYDPRWHYYLGESLKELGRLYHAFQAYAACWALDGWEEESASAAYKAALCSAPPAPRGSWKQVIEWCGKALARAPWMPEPAWLAACASLERNRPHDAIAWAHLAILHGNFKGRGAVMQRIGHQEPIAQWEGPYLVLAEAHKRLGDEGTSAHYLTLASQAGRRGRGDAPLSPLAPLHLHAVALTP